MLWLVVFPALLPAPLDLLLLLCPLLNGTLLLCTAHFLLLPVSLCLVTVPLLTLALLLRFAHAVVAFVLCLRLALLLHLAHAVVAFVLCLCFAWLLHLAHAVVTIVHLNLPVGFRPATLRFGHATVATLICCSELIISSTS